MFLFGRSRRLPQRGKVTWMLILLHPRLREPFRSHRAQPATHLEIGKGGQPAVCERRVVPVGFFRDVRDEHLGNDLFLLLFVVVDLLVGLIPAGPVVVEGALRFFPVVVSRDVNLLA
jgi:hypothetical protein